MITKQIWRQIKKAKVITIFRHVKPDADASGSQLGLKYLIEANCPRCKVYVLGEENKRWQNFIGAVDSNISDEIIESSLAIVLDVGDIKRVDDQRFLKAKSIIKIDHHVFVEKFTETSLEWVETSFSATCEMITKMAYDNRLMTTKEAATALYTGLVTDSGRFLYANVGESTFKYASYLIAKGINMQAIYDYIYVEDEISIRFKGYCQLNFIKTPNGLAYNKITKEILQSFNVSGNFGAGVVNVLSNMKGVHIHAHFSDREEGRIRVELRSKEIPVNLVATKYGGGGHKLASGAIVDSWEIVDNIINDLDDLCRMKNNENLPK